MTRILRLLAILAALVLPCVAGAQRTNLTLLKNDTIATRYEPKTDSVVRVTTTRFIITGKCGTSTVLRYEVAGAKAHRLSVDTIVIQVCAPPDIVPRQLTAVPNGCGIGPMALQDSMRKYGIRGDIGLDRQQDSLFRSWVCKP